MKFHAVKIFGQDASPFILALRLLRKKGRIEFVDSHEEADWLLPDLDLDQLIEDRLKPAKLVELIRGSLPAGCSSFEKVLLLTARTDFPCSYFKGATIVPCAIDPDSEEVRWFGPDFSKEGVEKDVDFCVSIPCRLDPSRSWWFTHIGLAGSTLMLEPSDTLENPEIAARSLRRSKLFVMPPPAPGANETMSLFAALSAGCVPVMIGDAKVHPLLDEVILKTPPGEGALAVLRDLADRISPQMARKSFDIFKARFSPEAVGQRVLANIESAKGEPPKVEEIDEMFWECPGDHWGFLKFMWKKIALVHPGSKGARLAIYGCGKMLPPLISSFVETQDAPFLECIIDDAPKTDSFAGIPVLKPENAKPVDVVFVGSDYFEDKIKRRAIEALPSSVRVIGVSDFFEEAGLDRLSYWQMPRGGSHLWRPGRKIVDKFISAKGRLSEKPKKLESVIVCVGYADFLHWTLPLNVKQFDKVVIVTSSTDADTQAVAKKNGACLVISDSYKENGASFNKAKMINAGAAALDGDGWILLSDADMIMPDDLRENLFRLTLHKNVLYYANRFDIPEQQPEAWLERYSSSGEGLEQISFHDADPVGYFQLFSPKAAAVKDVFPKIYSERFENAGGCDLQFFLRFDKHRFCHTQHCGLNAMHIPHGSLGSNWSGRQTPLLKGLKPSVNPAAIVATNNGGWMQVAYRVTEKLHIIRPIPEGGFLKLQRCSDGDFVIVENKPASDKSFPRFVNETVYSKECKSNVILCGVCDGKIGEVTIAFAEDGTPFSGWGFGLIHDLGWKSPVWNHKRVSHSDFDLLHRATISDEERKFLLT